MSSKTTPKQLTDLNQAVTLLRPHVNGMQEKFAVIFLNSRNIILATKTLFVGTINSQIISPREIVRECLDLGATSVLVSHNHPSEDVTPSDADVQTTLKIIQALQLFNISLEDHIIITKNSYYSFAEEGYL